MQKVLLAFALAFFLGIDSCSDDYEFCPNCKAGEATPTPTGTVSPTNTPSNTPTPGNTSNDQTASAGFEQESEQAPKVILAQHSVGVSDQNSFTNNEVKGYDLELEQRRAELKAQLKKALEEYKKLPTPIPVFTFSEDVAAE